MRLKLRWGYAACLLLGIGFSGCGDDDCIDCNYPQPDTTPADIVNNLQTAYKTRDKAAYAKLLADDFTFWFDAVSRPAGVPEYWTRLQDSTARARSPRSASTATSSSSISAEAARRPTRCPPRGHPASGSSSSGMTWRNRTRPRPVRRRPPRFRAGA